MSVRLEVSILLNDELQVYVFQKLTLKWIRKWQLSHWLIYPSTRIWILIISGFELTDTRVRNPICLFSSFSYLIQIVTPNLLNWPNRVQSDASAFSAMDPVQHWHDMGKNQKSFSFDVPMIIFSEKSFAASHVFRSSPSSILTFSFLQTLLCPNKVFIIIDKMTN